MKKRFFALMLGVAVCATSSVFAMESAIENDGNIPCPIHVRDDVKLDGGYDVTTCRPITVIDEINNTTTSGYETVVERHYPTHIDFSSTIPLYAFEAFATTGVFQMG